MAMFEVLETDMSTMPAVHRSLEAGAQPALRFLEPVLTMPAVNKAPVWAKAPKEARCVEERGGGRVDCREKVNKGKW